MNILVADDNELNRLVAAGLLRKLGHRVDVAVDGADALSALDRQSYDLLFLDIQMPDMDGYEVARRIRGRGDAVAALPVVALTADARPENRAACLAAGMNGWVTKPVTPNKLTEAIAACRPSAGP